MSVTPNFLIIGAMKSGTSTLAGLLRSHPGVFMATTKELHFFDRDENFAKGWEWYLAHFEDASDAVAIGEATPAYTRTGEFPQAPARIAARLPDAKLL